MGYRWVEKKWRCNMKKFDSTKPKYSHLFHTMVLFINFLPMKHKWKLFMKYQNPITRSPFSNHYTIRNFLIYDSIYEWFCNHTKHYMTKGPLVITNKLFRTRSHWMFECGTFHPIVIKDKSYIMLRYHVMND